MTGPGQHTVATNRKARHEYEILETLEAGIALVGTEVKALRQGKANIQDAYATIENGEVWLRNMHISPYEFGNRYNHDPLRPRKLLLHKREIMRLYGKTRERGLTLIPLRIYFKRGWAKVELALVRGKRQYDRRAEIAEREAKRELERLLKRHRA
ncbi:MAG: SsrA-binding protein SmpB [Bacteroidota bacterium]|nr:SsrA-binding protein SmpB [Bacteroidota bacterium]